MKFVIIVFLSVGVLCLLESANKRSITTSPNSSIPLSHQNSFRNYDSVYLDIRSVSDWCYVQEASRFHTEAKYYEVQDVNGDYYLIRVYPSIASSLNTFSSVRQNISKTSSIRIYGISGTIKKDVMEGVNAMMNDDLTGEEFHARYGYNVLSIGMDREKTLNSFQIIWALSLSLALLGLLRILKIC